MKQEIALKWADALESGKYDQTTSYLCDDAGYCCLGVLCELAMQDGVKITKSRSDLFTNRQFFYNYNDKVLPPEVQTWAGMIDSVGSFMEPLSISSLADLNDGHMGFSEIARMIRKYWSSL